MDELLEAYNEMRNFIMKDFIGYHRSGIDEDDLWQEVLIDGIMHYPEYDPALSKLKTWATYRGVWCIKSIVSKNQREVSGCDVYEIDVESRYTDESAAVSSYELVLRLSEELKSSERIVVKYFLEGASFESIGQRLWVTRQRVQALFKSAIRRMRRNHREELANIDIWKSRNGD